MGNRVLTVGDINTLPWVPLSNAQAGDILIETPTGIHGDGKLLFDIRDAGTNAAFVGARMGANIWVDGNMGTFYNFRLENGGVNEWMISNSTSYARFKPIPGTQIKGVKNASTNNGYLMILYDIQYFVVDGQNDAYSGLRNGWPPNSAFLRGSFGIWLSGGLYPENGHMLNTKPPDADYGHHIIKGVEAEHGFSGFRYAATQFAVGHPNRICDYTVDSCYIHDGGTGEGIYAGATHAGPMYIIRNLVIKNTIFARRACENIQVQLLSTSTDSRGLIKNNVSWAPAMDWLNAFQPNQDTTFQWHLEDGGNYVEKNIFDGGGSIVLNNFSGNQLTSKQSRPSIAQDNFFRGSGTFSYVHSSCQYGVNRVIRRGWLRDFNNDYYADSVNDLQNYFVSANNGGDKFIWMQLKHNGGKAAFFQDSSTPNFEYQGISDVADVVPDVEYVNSGAYEHPSKWKNFKKVYGEYHDNDILNRPVEYHQGDIVANIEQGTEYAFYKLLVDYTTLGDSDLTPRQHILAYGEVVYKRLYWDETGLRNDQVGFSGNNYSSYPPDDFRLVSNNFYNKLGYGLQCNEPNTDYTQYKWEVADDALGTGTKLVLDYHILERPPREEEQGKWLRLSILARNASGVNDTQWRLGPWRLVN
jgi:hypothetical protein